MAPLSAFGQTIGDSSKEQINIIEPTKKPNDIKNAAIDDERFEAGGYAGLIALEDFNAVSITGIHISFHLTPSWVLTAAYGKSGAPEASFEEVLGGNFVEDRDSGFQYIAVLGGYELYEGRSFRGKNKKFSTHLYLDAGIENVEFIGETNTGFVMGASYKIVINDWLTSDLRMRDHIVKRSFLEQNKITQNLELSFGLSALF